MLVLLLVVRSAYGIIQISPLNNIVFSYDEPAQIDLENFFRGQNMTFTVNKGSTIKQGLDLSSRTNTTNSVYLAKDPSRAYLYTLHKREFIVWSYDGQLGVKKISTTRISYVDTAVNIHTFMYNAETYTVIIGNGLNSLFISLYNTTDPTDITRIGYTSTSNNKIKASQIYIGFEVFIFVNVGSILPVQLTGNTNPIVYNPITREKLGLSRLSVNGMVFTDKTGILCDSRNGLISFNIEESLINQNITTKIQEDPLTYGTVYSCTGGHSNITVGTKEGLVIYSVPVLFFLQKYNKIETISDIFNIESYGQYVIGYFTTKRSTSIRLTNTHKPLNESVVFDVNTHSYFRYETPKFVLIEIEDRLYACLLYTSDAADE